jgi:hypothetical protein
MPAPPDVGSRDLAIVGFNDLEFMASAVPSLTSVRTNRYEMGRHAVTMVIDAIEGRRRRNRSRPRFSADGPRKLDAANPDDCPGSHASRDRKW